MSVKTVEKWIRKHWKLAGILVAVYLLVFRPFPMGTVGYLSGTQGLDPTFDSVYFNGYWSNNESGASTYIIPGTGTQVSPSTKSFGYSLDLDPDGAGEGKPDLCATTQALTRDSDAPIEYSWNFKVGSRTFDNGTIADEYKEFTMYRYTMDWAVNMWLTGSEWEADGKYNNNPNQYTVGLGSWAGAIIWIKLSPRAFCYFTQNPDHLYFAPSYVALKEPVQWVGVDNNGKIVQNDADIVKSQDIIPKASGEATGIYYSRGGGGTFEESTLQSFQGATLDREVFRDQYWIRFNLAQLQPVSWISFPASHGWKYPSAYLHFIVHLYVVGQWTVFYKTGEIPALTPHTPIMNVPTGWEWFTNWFNNPLNQLWSFFLIIVIVVLAVSVSSPGVWSLLAMRKRSKE